MGWESGRERRRLLAGVESMEVASKRGGGDDGERWKVKQHGD